MVTPVNKITDTYNVIGHTQSELGGLGVSQTAPVETKNTKPRTLAEQTRLRQVSAELYVEIGQHEAVVPYRDQEGKAALRVPYAAYNKLSPKAKSILGIADELSFLMKLEIYVASRIYGGGPKIFRPTAEQLFALEKMKLNIEIRDFYTPFETIVVEIPEEYSKARTHVSERAINYSVLVFNKKHNFLVHDIVYDEHALKSYWMTTSEEEVLEDWFAASVDKAEPLDTDYLPGDIVTSWAEYKLEMLVRRAVCNYCLFLDEVGTKQVGPVHPGEYHQLVKWCEKKNQHTAGNKIKLASQPIIYKMKAVPTPLVRNISSDKPEMPFGKSGKIMPYHVRRGHYKMQPFGPRDQVKEKNEDGTYRNRKRIRIPATIINAHLAPGILPTQEYTT